METIKLEDLKPKKSKFEIHTENKTFSFSMREITLNDKIFFKQKYSEDGFEKVFKYLNYSEIVKIVYRLIDDKDKLQLKKQKVLTVDEDGNEKELEIGGVELFATLIVGQQAETDMINALLASAGVSSKLNDEEKENSGEDKKKESQQTGEI